MHGAYLDNSFSLAPLRPSSKNRLQPILKEDVSRYPFVYSHAQMMWARKPSSWPHCQTRGDSIRPACQGPCRSQNRSLRQLEDMIRAIPLELQARVA